MIEVTVHDVTIESVTRMDGALRIAMRDELGRLHFQVLRIPTIIPRTVIDIPVQRERR
jgi:hypothetical protein